MVTVRPLFAQLATPTTAHPEVLHEEVVHQVVHRQCMKQWSVECMKQCTEQPAPQERHGAIEEHGTECA